MKTANKPNKANLETLSEGQLKAIALMEFNGDDYFVYDGEVYEGDEDAVMESYEAAKMEFLTFEDFLQAECSTIEEIDGDDERDNYIVLTDEEADEKCADYIKDSLWAFTPQFLSERTDLDVEVFEAIQSNNKCEDNNDTIYRLIEKLDDIDSFVEAAISADGRGHFMNTYDGNENEERVNGQTFYIYRVN